MTVRNEIKQLVLQRVSVDVLVNDLVKDIISIMHISSRDYFMYFHCDDTGDSKLLRYMKKCGLIGREWREVAEDDTKGFELSHEGKELYDKLSREIYSKEERYTLKRLLKIT